MKIEETDPVDYAFVDENNSNSEALPLDEEANGFQANQDLPDDKFNALHRGHARWSRFIDQSRAPAASTYGEVTCRLSSDGFSYSAVGLVATLEHDVELLVEGKYISITSARLTRWGMGGLLSYTLTASSAHHFYIEASGKIEVEVVALATPPSPGAGQVHLHTVNTGLITISSQVVGDAFKRQAVMVATPHVFEDEVEISDQGSGAATLSFGTDDPAEGWTLETGALGLNLKLFERNMLNAVVVDFGNDSEDVTFHRDTTCAFNFEVDGDLTIGKGRTHSGAGWLVFRTHNAGSFDAGWGVYNATTVLRNAADNGVRHIDSPDLPLGAYYGTIELVIVEKAAPSITYSRKYQAMAVQVGGVASFSNASIFDTVSFIGGLTVAVSGNGAKLRVSATIPNLGGKIYNINVAWRLARVTVD